MERKRILSLTMEAGNGHKSQALAIHEAIMQRYPDQFEIITLDTFKDLNSPRLDALYKNTWKKALNWPHSLLMALYVPWKSRLLTHGFERIFGAHCFGRLKKQIDEIKPDLIISTHFTPTHFLSVLKRRGQLNVPFVVVHSEPYDTFASWQHYQIDYYVCYSELVGERLRNTCQCKDVAVFNFPLNAKFSQAIGEQHELREKLGLEKDKLTVLVSCGGEGIGLPEEYLEKLFESGLPWQVVVICGRNEALKNRLEAKQLPEDSPIRLKAFGFMKNMPEFITASDLVMGKAGPATTFESLVLGRPVMQTFYVPQEQGVMRFVTGKNLGWYAPTVEQFIKIMRELAENPETLRQRQRYIGEQGFKDGSADIADYIVGVLKKNEQLHSA